MTTGAQLIADERRRQIDQEGWTAEHDKQHESMDLAAAGVCYALQAIQPVDYADPDNPETPDGWPWAECWWKPKDELKDLVRAGALLAAAIDRLQEEQSNAELTGSEQPEKGTA